VPGVHRTPRNCEGQWDLDENNLIPRAAPLQLLGEGECRNEQSNGGEGNVRWSCLFSGTSAMETTAQQGDETKMMMMMIR
jgi:hypothetical protein